MIEFKTKPTVSRGTEARQSPPRAVVLHIPHSSRYVPPRERQTILLDDAQLDIELLRMTDAYTNELFPSTPVEAGRVIFPASRLVCDVERFSSDEREPMANRGMGVIYTRTSMGEPLRVRPSPDERQFLLDRWYWPHHWKLERRVNDVASRLGRCLIVDCHSFPSVALPYELDQTEQRADICIGTDPFHTPSIISDTLVDVAEKAGYSVMIDAPFSGALVPLAAYQTDRRIMSVMIEVSRRLYMDERSGEKRENFDQVCAVIGKLIMSAAKATQATLDAR